MIRSKQPPSEDIGRVIECKKEHILSLFSTTYDDPHQTIDAMNSYPESRQGMRFAVGAVLLWASLAALGVRLNHVPPFLLTGLGLLTGALVALPLSRGRWRDWKVAPATLAVGVLGLFGYHVLLFAALQLAPPVQVNLLNYLWPLLIVVLAPLYLKGMQLRLAHALAALLGFGGAVLAVLDGARASGTSLDASMDASTLAGYLLAVAAALTWASYSLLGRRVPPYRTAAIGGLSLGAGLLSLLCHWLFEAPVTLTSADMALIALLGVGPLGGAFFVWDAALKRTDPRTVGLLAFLTPLLSTALLLWSSGQRPSFLLALATLMIVGAAVIGTRKFR